MSNANHEVLNAVRVTKEVISAKDFVSLNKQQKAAIRSAEIAAPRLGGKGFGGILVEYKSPIYKVF